MKIRFEIDYATRWGETLHISGDIPELGSGRITEALPMSVTDGSKWSAEVEVSPARSVFSYRYIVRRDDGTERDEWGRPHTCRISPQAMSVRIIDAWSDTPADSAMYSAAFADSILRHPGNSQPQEITPGHLTIKVAAPAVPPSMVLAVSGSIPALGCWDVKSALVMDSAEFPFWTCELPLEQAAGGMEYKFLLLDAATHELMGWERHDNRSLNLPDAVTGEAVMVAGLRFADPLAPWRGAGVVLPVFSLRSEHDFGAGDFYDLIPLVNWAHQAGMKFIQVLPVNDTTMTRKWTDSYPYNANSTFALHPMYLRLEAMGELADRHRQSEFDALRSELNSLPAMDYERVNNAKNEFTRALFAERGKEEMATADFKKFMEANSEWLLPYAAFCTLRDRFGTPDMRAWADYSTYDKKKVEQFIEANRNDVDYVCYIQYHLDRQLRHVHEYARSRGVALKGDIPIGISRDSVDAWMYPELFNLQASAGAPPDDFSVLGQNWGFPTYNWERMAKDGYAWWKARFRKMAEYFDAYRIDHILGFFRIWQIPLEAVHGLLGTFNPAMPFTPDELKYSYDFTFDPALHTEPYITDETVDALPPEVAAALRQSCLEAIDGHRYRLPAHINTQRKVADYFGRPENRNELAPQMCDALLDMLDQVLFIEDPVQKGKYHPRISGRDTAAYRSLTEYERNAFDRLHEDFYYHRHNDFWREKAMKRLPVLIDATDMLVCGEDLGMIPMCVPEVMDALKILSLKIQRMPSELYAEFGHTKRYPWMSVCATSTHDMSGIREWWTENPESSARFYHDILGLEGDAPAEATPEICRDIVRMHLESPSMLCLLPWQDWMSIDGALRYPDPAAERINIPACPRHYWRYRMHMTLEQLMAAENLNGEIRNLIARSGR